MASFNKVNSFVQDLGRKIFNLHTDTLKVILTNTAPTSASAVLSDITQIANGNGYTTDGTAAGSNSFTQSSGTAKLIVADVVFTASGAMGPFRYAVLYDSTAASGQIIGWWDYGSSITLASGETFTVDFDGTNGVLQLA